MWHRAQRSRSFAASVGVGHYAWRIVADDSPTPDPDDHLSLASRDEAFAELADLDAERAEAEPDDVDPGAGVDAAPPVVAVVVVHNADSGLDDVLRSLDRQTYENLSVLVIDAASDIDPTPRVARILPGAFVRRLESNLGFGPTVNEILDLVSGASFFCLCHDDVAMDDDAVHELVAEAFRSNAGIVGPKTVDWDDPDRLSSVGFTIDRSAGRAPYAERGELDQGQHDAVRDVFAVTGGCTLVRSDLFAHLGGFDPAIDLLGEDLDLCWRAHLVGARVVVAPRARVRHRERLAERVDASRLVRVDAAHRIRAVLTNSRLARLFVLIPQLIVISVVEAIVEVTIGRRRHAAAQLAAWGTTIRSFGSIRRSRRKVHALRERNDRSIARLQTTTWARLDGLVQANRRERASGLDEPIAPVEVREGRDTHSLDDEDREGFVRTGSGRRSYSLVTWGVILVSLVSVVGTRELFFGALPPVGTFAEAPRSLSDVWRTWSGSWNPAGLGSAQAPAAGLGPQAVVGTLFGGAFGFLRRVAILLPVPIGLFGVWRLTRTFGSGRASLVALVMYAAVPVPWNCLATGNWSGLVVYAVSPWILHRLAGVSSLYPFVESGDTRGARWWSPVLGFGLVLAVVGSVVPAIGPVVIVMTVGFVAGSLLVGRVEGLGRLILTCVGAILVAAVLLIPWTFVGPGRSLWSLAGIGGGVHGWLGIGRILRFQAGPMGAGVLGFAFLVVATLPLLIGRSWRFVWGVRSWGVAAACFATVWLGQQRWFGLPTPTPAVLLAPAAAALAFAAVCGVVAFEEDLPSFRFGWAQGATLLATVALVASVLPWVGNAADGRWRMAPVGLDQALEFISTQRDTSRFRVLWVADPAVLPVAGWRLDDHTSFGVTDRTMADTTELWAPADKGASAMLVDTLDLAMRSETTRAGRILADAGIRYVVLPRQSVPLPYRSDAHPIPSRLLAALDDQLDLARESSANDAVLVYRNEAWRPGARLLPTGTDVGSSVADTLDAPGGEVVRGQVDPTRRSRLSIPAAGILATGQPADSSWRLEVDGVAAKRVTLWGWEQGFEIPRAGAATLERSAGPGRPVVLVVIAGLWLVVAFGWFVGRRDRADEDLLDTSEADDAGEGSLVRLGSDPQRVEAVTVSSVRVGGKPTGEGDDGAVPEETPDGSEDRSATGDDES